MTDLKGLAPLYGKDCSDEYVNSYEIEHLNGHDNFSYDLGHIHCHVIDSLFNHYDLLEFGCGTAGFTSLFKRMNSYAGVDYSQKMIDVAKRINPNSDFECMNIENFETSKKFDVVIDTVTGNYRAHTRQHVDKVMDYLKPDGMAVLLIQNYTNNIFRQLKRGAGDLLKNRQTNHISKNNFNKYISKYSTIMTLGKQNNNQEWVLYFLENVNKC